MDAYCNMFEVDDIEMFVRLMTAMDVAYLDVKRREDK